MNGREAGFLLLTSHLGDPRRRVLTVPQLRTLAKRVGELEKEDRELTAEDLVSIGYDRAMAERMLALLDSEEQLSWYVKKGERVSCVPVARVNPMYPEILKKRLGWDCPGCLWAKGDLSLLTRPAVALVGSRDLRPENRRFAEEAGWQAAKQGFILISGNARGADKAAQDACLAAGGQVISVVADSLEGHMLQPNTLYLSEDGFDLPFSPRRALSRNRVIHALGMRTLVAQCSLGKGGTWDGTVKNLRSGCSPVFCFRDGSSAMTELAAMGARLVTEQELENLQALLPDELTFIDR